MELRYLERNIAANEAYAKIHYPGENFISDISEIQAVKKYINRHEVRRRIVMVLDRHPDYTGKIVVSFQGKSIYFWDTSSFR